MKNVAVTPMMVVLIVSMLILFITPAIQNLEKSFKGLEATLTWYVLCGIAMILMTTIIYKLFEPINTVMALHDLGFNHLNSEAKRLKLPKSDVIKQSLKSRNIGDIPPVYPNGWFVIAESEEVKMEEVKSVNVLGLNLAVFRNSDGIVRVMDAYCPHLGVNMAVGGKVSGDCITCPFHGWTFSGSEGKCVSIPYAKKVPDFASVKTHDVKEAHECIYLWYHAENEPPLWDVTRDEKDSNEVWKCFGRIEFNIAAHIQDVVENGADLRHFDIVHRKFLPNLGFGTMTILPTFLRHAWDTHWAPSEQPENKHCALTKVKQLLEVFGKYELFPINLTIKQRGPALAIVKYNLTSSSLKTLISITPCKPMLQKVVHRFYTKSPWYHIPLLKVLAFLEVEMFERDVLFWNSKKYQKRPLLVSGDECISGFRRWYSQFYSKNRNQSCNIEDW